MSKHVLGKTSVHGYDYESAWLSRWARRGSGFESESPDAKCSKEIPEDDGQLLKESKDSMKLKGKMFSGFLDLFPNPGLAVQRVETIPDMNKEPDIDADRNVSEFGEEGETSSSATKSKNVEHFLRESKRLRSDPEANSRSHLKRLKTKASDYSGNETESMMDVGEGPSVEKVNYLFHRILKCGINKPGPRRNQEPYTSQIKNLNMGRGGGEDMTTPLQQPWIQRWCNKKAVETHEQRRGQLVKPKGTALEKQFPSIAAMALMKKALNRLTPTGLTKTDSLLVWNAQDLE